VIIFRLVIPRLADWRMPVDRGIQNVLKNTGFLVALRLHGMTAVLIFTKNA
jgi:hypothetical protein